MTESKRYLDELRHALPRGVRRRVVSEFRTHLADGIAAEVARGMDRDAAELMIIERLGPPERVAAQYPDDAPRSQWRGPLTIAVAVLVVAGIAALVAVTQTSHAKPAPSVAAARLATPNGPVVVPRIYIQQGEVADAIHVVQSASLGVVARQCYFRATHAASSTQGTVVCGPRRTGR